MCAKSLKGKAWTQTVCTISSKGKARTLKSCVTSDPYINIVNYLGWVQPSSLVSPIRHKTAYAITPKAKSRILKNMCTIGPKGEARTFEPDATSEINEIIYFGWVKLSSPMRPKRRRPRWAISP